MKKNIIIALAIVLFGIWIYWGLRFYIKTSSNNTPLFINFIIKEEAFSGGQEKGFILHWELTKKFECNSNPSIQTELTHSWNQLRLILGEISVWKRNRDDTTCFYLDSKNITRQITFALPLPLESWENFLEVIKGADIDQYKITLQSNQFSVNGIKSEFSRIP